MQSAKPRPSRLVGVDYGMARIGLAISDERKIIAVPLLVMKTEKKLEQTVIKLSDTLLSAAQQGKYDIAEIIIGLPLRMSGQRGVMADEVAIFADLLKARMAIPIVLWDERLTSVQADRAMREAQLSRKRRSELADTVAAVIILQSYLDSRHTGEGSR